MRRVFLPWKSILAKVLGAIHFRAKSHGFIPSLEKLNAKILLPRELPRENLFSFFFQQRHDRLLSKLVLLVAEEKHLSDYFYVLLNFPPVPSYLILGERVS